LVSFIPDELSEVCRRACKNRSAQIRIPRHNSGISEAGIDLLIESFDYFSGRILGSANPKPAARLIARQVRGERRNVWQRLRPGQRRYRQGTQLAGPDVLDR